MSSTLQVNLYEGKGINMNIEIANRLVELRKKRGLSQEDLAQELGISRQAVSKWERAESSPDTDNLILLARLYGISLDEMLKTDEEIIMDEEDNTSKNEESETKEENKKDFVHIGWDGIHVKDGDDIVDISWNGIHVNSKDGEEFVAGGDGVFVKGKKVNQDEWYGWCSSDEADWDEDEDESFKRYPRTFLDYIPYGIIAFLVFLYLGVFEQLWHPAWIILFTIPIYTSFAKTVRKRNLYCFNYFMVAVTIFFYVGFVYNAWHPGWVVFVTIPVYYYLAHFFKRLFKKKKSKVINAEWNENEEASKVDEK